MDPRIQATVTKLLAELGIEDGNYDRLAFAGGAGLYFDFIREQLMLSKDLHQSTKALLTVHEDCGAGAKTEDLAKAKAVAEELDFEPLLYTIKLDGSWEIYAA